MIAICHGQSVALVLFSPSLIVKHTTFPLKSDMAHELGPFCSPLICRWKIDEEFQAKGMIFCNVHD